MTRRNGEIILFWRICHLDIFFTDTKLTNITTVTFKNSVPSEVTTTSGGEREKQGNESSKTVLSGPEEEGTYNRFSCFAV